MDDKKLIAIVLLLFILSASYGQDVGKINGRLIVDDLENRELISNNTFVILKSNTYVDSVKVDTNLSFEFKNIESDTIRLYLSPRSYPSNTFYKFYLNKGESKNLELPYSPTCPYGKSDICPICHKKDKAIPIVYGFVIGGEEKKEKYKLGGCIVSDCQPTWYCRRDKTDF